MLSVPGITYLNSVNKLIFAIIKSCVFYAVRAGFLKRYVDELWIEWVAMLRVTVRGRGLKWGPAEYEAMAVKLSRIL